MFNNIFQLKILSPNGILYDDHCDMLEFETIYGERGIYKNHVPTIEILVPCTIIIHQNNEIKKYKISGGVIEILYDKVNILTNEIVIQDNLDV